MPYPKPYSKSEKAIKSSKRPTGAAAKKKAMSRKAKGK